ncbi:MAG: cupredoxin family copper-binding protein [archaeon]|jgi:plastocyanin
MINSIWIILLIIGIMIVLLFFRKKINFNQSTTTTTTTTTNDSENNLKQTTNTPSQSQGSVNIQISNLAFKPQAITVYAGTTVVWKNMDNVSHTVTFDNGGFDSGEITLGNSKSYTFTSSGKFAYHCTMHSNMNGTIVVR